MKYGMTILCLTALLITGGCDKQKNIAPMAEILAAAVVDLNGESVPAQSLLDTDYLLLYFSAHWCPPCRAFTPKLVNFYNTNGGGQLFDALLISSDHSEAEQFNYMKETHMPWSTVQYQSDAAKKLNKTYSGGGIPRLVLVNPQGEILADSFKGRTYLGPQVVLEKLKELLGDQKPVATQTDDTADTLAQKFKVNGFGQGTENEIAIINGQFTDVGTELEEGVIVEQVTTTYVEVSFEGKRYRLYP